MKKSKFSASRRQAIVVEGQSVQQSIEKLCEVYQISPATNYKWRKELETAQDED